MSAVIALLMVIFALAWGSVFLVVYLKRSGDEPLIDSSEDVRRLQEALDDLGTRVNTLEEERDFYRALIESPDARRIGPDANAE